MSTKNFIALSCLISFCLSACGTEFDESLARIHFAENGGAYAHTNSALEEWSSAEELADAGEVTDEPASAVEESADEDIVEDYFDEDVYAYDDSTEDSWNSPEHLAQADEAADTSEECVESAEQCIVAMDLTLGKNTLTKISDAIYQAIAKKLADGGVLADLANDNSLAEVQHLTQEVKNILRLIKSMGVRSPGCELHLNVYLNKPQLRRTIIKLIAKLVANFPQKRKRSGRPGRPHPWIGKKIDQEKGLVFNRIVEPMVEQVWVNLEQQVRDFVGNDSSLSVHILETEEVRDDLHLVIDYNGNDILDVTGDKISKWIKLFQKLNPFAEQGSCDQ